MRTLDQILEGSRSISKLAREGRIAVVGTLYDVQSGRLEILAEESYLPESADDHQCDPLATTC